MSELDGSRMLRRGFVARRFLCTNWTELQHLRLAFQPRRKTRCILRCEPPKAHFWRHRHGMRSLLHFKKRMTQFVLYIMLITLRCYLPVY